MIPAKVYMAVGESENALALLHKLYTKAGFILIIMSSLIPLNFSSFNILIFLVDPHVSRNPLYIFVFIMKS